MAHGEPWTRALRVGARQFEVVSHEQLLACGLTRHQIRTLVRQGHLHRIYRGVYAVGHPRLSPPGRLQAALLAAGPGAWLSGRSAAAARGLRSLNHRAVELTVVGGRAHRREGLAITRAAREPHRGEITSYGGLRVSSVPRLLVELAARETRGELGRLITLAARKGQLDLHALAATVHRHAGRSGIANLRAAAAEYLPRKDRRSELELAFDAMLADTAEIPEPRRNVQIAGWEIDCWWPEQRLAVELDGRPYHVAVQDMERDRRKDIDLAKLDICALRITGSRMQWDRAGVLADVLTVVRLRAARLVRSPGGARQPG